jgi:hypothetical protein
MDCVNNLAEDIGVLHCHAMEVEQMMECLLAEIKTDHTLLPVSNSFLLLPTLYLEMVAAFIPSSIVMFT